MRGVDDAVNRRGKCTGIAATWCPRCGDCTCDLDPLTGERTLDDHFCPLHGLESKHAERFGE